MFASLLDPYLDESHLAFRDVCRRFADDHIRPHVDAWERDESFPNELFALAGEAGVLAPTFPEELGGAGGDLFHGLVASEELIKAGSNGVSAGLGSLQIALPPILHLGSDEQKMRLCKPVCEGKKIAALAITEPNTGSDVAGVATTAKRDGDHYVLDGAKTFITSGIRADFVMVLARTSPDPHGGLTFFAVEKGTPGFSVSRALKKTGWCASDTAELAFEDCRVPTHNRIGPEGSGFIALMRNFENERLLLAINGHALAELAFFEARRYVDERSAFGRPISTFQVTRHKLADMATRVAASKALTYSVADQMRRGVPVPALVAMAKNQGAETAEWVCREAVQLHGGMGYMRETLVERLARDARLLAIGGGTTEIMKEIIWRMGMSQ